MDITGTQLSTLLGGWSEVQVVLLVLGIVVVGVAMLSYFVIAPEYEKHLTKEFEYQEHRKPSFSSCKQPAAMSNPHMETAFSDDDDQGRDSNEKRAARRRASNPEVHSDVLHHISLNKAEMFRRRVLLRKLEQEIDGAIHENHHQSTQKTTKNDQPHYDSHPKTVFTAERLNQLQNHPADCTAEIVLLEKMTQSTKHNHTMKQALELIHDVLSYNLSSEHRDMNKVTVLCNSLLKHDGLNHLRQLEHASEPKVRKLANDIIEKAVPAIWH